MPIVLLPSGVVASISNYGELKTAVASWLDRTDLASAAADFVHLGESDIANDVRCRAMESRATGTLTAETLPHPDRMVEARFLSVNGRVHEYRTPEAYEQASQAGATLRIYTSIGQNFYVLGGAGGSYVLISYQAFERFYDDTDTNWLLENAPEVYLWAAVKHGAIYTHDREKEVMAEERYAKAVLRLNNREKAAAHSGSRLSILPATFE